jgi:hypothetical protein
LPWISKKTQLAESAALIWVSWVVFIILWSAEALDRVVEVAIEKNPWGVYAHTD